MVKLAKYLQVAAISMGNRLAYLTDHLASSLFILLVIFVFSQVWQALGDGFIGGLTTVEILWYLVFTEAITLSCPAIHRMVSEEVKSGELAYKLVRPMYYPGYYFSLHWGEFAIRYLTNLLVGGLFSLLMVGVPDLQWQYLPFWLFGLALAVSLNFLLMFSLALLAFWLEENQPFFWIYSKMVFVFGGLFVPVEAYPPLLRNVSYLLPFRYGVSAPARLIIRFEWGFFYNMAIGQVIWLAIMLMVVSFMFSRGVKQVHVQGG